MGTPHSSLELTWLVGAKADYDVERTIWDWEVTTRQDQTITENNQTGILSSRYQPGQYSEHERRVITFQQWYLSQFSHLPGKIGKH